MLAPQIICLTDLEQDFINPYDLSAKLNRFVVSILFVLCGAHTVCASMPACKLVTAAMLMCMDCTCRLHL